MYKTYYNYNLDLFLISCNKQFIAANSSEKFKKSVGVINCKSNQNASIKNTQQNNIENIFFSYSGCMFLIEASKKFQVLCSEIEIPVGLVYFTHLTTLDVFH